MTRSTRALRGAALFACAAIVAAGCSSGSGSSTSGPKTTSKGLTGNLEGNTNGFGASTLPLNKGGTKGGTLNIGFAADVDYMDPGRTYYAVSWNAHQAWLNRQMLVYKESPDPKVASTLTGDLATAPATGEQGNTVWKYTLKSGVKYQDGSPVTSKDIKYAIERVFAADVINGGPTYFNKFLCPTKVAGSSCPAYKGPYTDKDPNHLGLSTIVTPDDTHIEFHLSQPCPFFNFLMAMPQTSPVPQSVDLNSKTGGNNYNFHDVSTGPYQIQSYSPGKKMVLVRNPNYDPKTDGLRPAYPDQIVVNEGLDVNAIDAGIEAGTYDLDMAATGVQPTEQAKILASPALKARSLDPITGFVRYISIFTKVAPFTNVHCRKAVEWIVNKQEQVRGRGGQYGGAPATTMGPPTLAGFQSFDLYPTANNEGDAAKAKQELAACGHPNGFNTIIAVRNKGKEVADAEFLQQDLAKIGIKAQVKQFDIATYFSSVIGIPKNVHKNKFGLAMAGWGPDFPAPYGYYDQILDPAAIVPAGNSNYAECDDPALTDLVNKSLTAASETESNQAWTDFDKKVLDDACEVPGVYDKALNLFSTRLKNVVWMYAITGADLRLVAVQ